MKKESVSASSPAGKWFLIIGFLAAVSIGTFLIFAPILFPEFGEFLKGSELLWAAFFVTLILAFPIPIGLFPWVYATRWDVSEKIISFYVPVSFSQVFHRSFDNSDIVRLTEGMLFSRVFRADRTCFQVPRFLRDRKDSQQILKFAVVEGRLELVPCGFCHGH